MDEIDAIGGRRFSEGTSADREIQRTLMELLNQLDGFDQLGKVHYFVQEHSSRLCFEANVLALSTASLHAIVKLFILFHDFPHKAGEEWGIMVAFLVIVNF